MCIGRTFQLHKEPQAAHVPPEPYTPYTASLRCIRFEMRGNDMNAHFDPGAAAARIDEIERLVNEENDRFEAEENAGRITGRAGEKHYELIESYEEERQALDEQLKTWRAV